MQVLLEVVTALVNIISSSITGDTAIEKYSETLPAVVMEIANLIENKSGNAKDAIKLLKKKLHKFDQDKNLAADAKKFITKLEAVILN